MNKYITYLLCLTLSITIYSMEQEPTNLDPYSNKKYPQGEQPRQIMGFIAYGTLKELEDFQTRNSVSFNFFYGHDVLSPLGYATQLGKKDFVAYLIEQKTLVNEQHIQSINIDTDDPLVKPTLIRNVISCLEGQSKIAPETLDEIMKSNILRRGPTPLHAAAYGNSGTFSETIVLELVKILLDAGGNPNLKIYGGKSLKWKYIPQKPADTADIYGYLQTSALLRQHEDITLEKQEDIGTLQHLENYYGGHKTVSCPTTVKKGHIALLMHKLFKTNFTLINEMQKGIAQKNNQTYTPPSEPACFLDIYDQLCENNIKKLFTTLEIPQEKQDEITKKTGIQFSDNYMVIYQECFPPSQVVAEAKKIAQQYRPEKMKQ